MTNNDILRRTRYIFNFGDQSMMNLFESGGMKVERDVVSDWLKKDDDIAFEPINDRKLAIFLNGFINLKRGKKEGPAIEPEKQLTNNIILRKFKIALTLQTEDIIHLIGLGGMKVSKHEITALFRKPGQGQYKEMKDQMLRNFMVGLEKKYRKADKK